MGKYKVLEKKCEKRLAVSGYMAPVECYVEETGSKKLKSTVGQFFKFLTEASSI